MSSVELSGALPAAAVVPTGAVVLFGAAHVSGAQALSWYAASLTVGLALGLILGWLAPLV